MALKASASREDALTEEVAEIWRRSLNLRSRIAANANFGSLGGDSLLLMAILDEVGETYGVEFDLDELLADLTVAGMVRAMIAAHAPRDASA